MKETGLEKLQEAVSLLLMAYIFIIFCMYPLYMNSGYGQIGSDKFYFYRDITVGAFCLIVPLAFIAFVGKWRTKGKVKSPGLSFSLVDAAVIFYAISVLLSYLFSDCKREALWGDRGWHMGLVTQLLFILSYFLVTRFWEFEEKILYAFMVTAFVVFGLGLLNRFSIFPIAIKGAQSSFISTLGNINWYSGYFSVLFPIGFCMYWFTDRKGEKAVALLFTVIGTATGVSQGSNSAFIVFAGLYLIVFCLSFRSTKRMRSFFELVILFCITCQGLRVWRLLVPDSFDYYSGTLSDWITMSRVTLYALVPAVIIYILLVLSEKKKKMDIRKYKIWRQLLLLLVVITAGVYIMLLVLNTRISGGIRFMGEEAALNFSKNWGSSRGGTWMAGVDAFKGIPGMKKLVGVGPDCFAMHLYTLPDVTERVMDQFDTSRLSNAHNEILTSLVNYGIIGMLSYLGIFMSAMIKFIYKAEILKKPVLYIFGISVFAYVIHNMVSFQQILSTPFIFIMIGMGERLIRESKAKEKIF